MQLRREAGCGPEEGSYVRLIDSCITQLKAQGPSRTCNESEEEDNLMQLCRQAGCARLAGGGREGRGCREPGCRSGCEGERLL